MRATQRTCICRGLTLDVDRHYIGSVTVTTHQEKGIIKLESNPSRGTVLRAPHCKGQLYDGCVTLQSGSFWHLLVIQRESQVITVSFLQGDVSENVDIDLCRAVQLFFNQTIQRILSTYQMASSDVTDDFLTITCRPHTLSRQLKEIDESVRKSYKHI